MFDYLKILIPFCVFLLMIFSFRSPLLFPCIYAVRCVGWMPAGSSIVCIQQCSVHGAGLDWHTHAAGQYKGN